MDKYVKIVTYLQIFIAAKILIQFWLLFIWFHKCVRHRFFGDVNLNFQFYTIKPNELGWKRTIFVLRQNLKAHQMILTVNKLNDRSTQRKQRAR